MCLVENIAQLMDSLGDHGLPLMTGKNKRIYISKITVS